MCGYSVYYRKRLLDIGNGRMEAFKNKSRYIIKTNIREENIIEIGELNFFAASEKKEEVFYKVDMASGFCECKAGSNYGPCKHKAAISKFFSISEFSVLPKFDQNIRGLYHYIAEGVVCANSWYRELNKPEHETNVHEFVEARSNDINNLSNILHVTNNAEDPTEAQDIDNLSSSNNSDEEASDGNLEEFVKTIDLFKQKIVTTHNKTLGKGVSQKNCKNFRNKVEQPLKNHYSV